MTKEQAKKRIKFITNFYDVPPYLRGYIHEAVDSDHWDFYSQSDGCTFIRESWPDPFYPPCIVHDYMRQNKILSEFEQDLIFKDLLDAFNKSRFKALLFFLGVRFSWFIFRK
jgi:hypothetical protein